MPRRITFLRSIVTSADIEARISDLNAKRSSGKMSGYILGKHEMNLALDVLYTIAEGHLRISQTAQAYKQLDQLAKCALRGLERR